jgi:hypothetical protein
MQKQLVTPLLAARLLKRHRPLTQEQDLFHQPAAAATARQQQVACHHVCCNGCCCCSCRKHMLAPVPQPAAAGAARQPSHTCHVLAAMTAVAAPVPLTCGQLLTTLPLLLTINSLFLPLTCPA